MRKMNNKGFSMVEILISIAIFAVLMIPIVGAIISSLKNTTEAKTLQYRNEFVENVVEYIKQDSLSSIFAGDYFTTVGSYTATAGKPIDVSATFYKKSTDLNYDPALKPIAEMIVANGGTIPATTPNTNVTEDIGDKEFPYEVYTLTGNVDLGAKDTTYSYKVEISNKYYAEKEKAAADMGKIYSNPNNLALGVVEDLDYTKLALINGTIANYDKTVSDAFLTKKVSILKDYEPSSYEQYVNQSTYFNMFPNDMVKRLISIKVKGSEDTGYTVTCSLKYHDDGKSITAVQNQLADYYIEYEPFEFQYPVDATTGKATLPNIYLMYNVCWYNGDLVRDDYIAIDTAGVTDDTEVKCFVVETAAQYSESLVEANEGSATALDGTKILYNNRSETGYTRDQTTIHMAATSGSTLSNLSIYHNFDIAENTGNNKKNGKIVYKPGTEFVFDTVWGNADLTKGPVVSYVPLVVDHEVGGVSVKDPTQSVANFGYLNEANEESRGLYEIKVWMVEGDDPSAITDTTQPIMTATKGGDES